MEKINLHTHSFFCDGKNSIEDMVLTAIEKGFTTLGFSGHSMYPFACDWGIAPRSHGKYAEEVRRIAEKYKDKIEILLGFEADYVKGLCSPVKANFKEFKPDYLIGSVHFLLKPEGQTTVDDTAENVKKGLDELYKGDVKAYIHDYFEFQRQMLRQGDFEVWGHPDLVRKRNPVLKFFSEEEEWYKDEVRKTVKVAKGKDIVAEINSGAIARGCMDDFYPSEFFLELLHQAKIPVCINSDCHDKNMLDFAYDRAVLQAKKIGYKELVYPAAGSKRIVKI